MIDRVIRIAVLAVLLVPWLSYGQILIDDEQTFAGLHGVFVVVEEPSSELAQYGVSKSAIKTAVELRLRQFGIRVYSYDGWRSDPRSPFLHVNVNALRGDGALNGVFAYNSYVGLRQEVTFLGSEMHAIADTWRLNSVGFAGIRQVDSIQETVLSQVDVFVNNYLAANPDLSK